VLLGVAVTPGDVHDSMPYLTHIEAIYRDVLQFQVMAADAAYDFPLVHQELKS